MRRSRRSWSAPSSSRSPSTPLETSWSRASATQARRCACPCRRGAPSCRSRSSTERRRLGPVGRRRASCRPPRRRHPQQAANRCAPAARARPAVLHGRRQPGGPVGAPATPQRRPRQADSRASCASASCGRSRSRRTGSARASSALRAPRQARRLRRRPHPAHARLRDGRHDPHLPDARRAPGQARTGRGHQHRPLARRAVLRVPRGRDRHDARRPARARPREPVRRAGCPACSSTPTTTPTRSSACAPTSGCCARLRAMRSGVLVTTRPGFNVLAARHAPPELTVVGQEHMNIALAPARPHARHRAHATDGSTRSPCSPTPTAPTTRGCSPARATRVEQIPNAVPELDGGDRRSPDSRIVVAAGRLTPQKGFDLLIRAFADVVARAPGLAAAHLRRRARSARSCAG